jgi:hypothetical protein
MRHPMFRRSLPCLALIACLAGCGSSSGGATLSASAATSLQQQLATLRSDAARGDRSGALTSIATLTALVSQDAAAGQLTPTQRQALLTGLERLRSRLSSAGAAQVAPKTTTPATATTPTTTAAPRATTATTATNASSATRAAPASAPAAATPAAHAPASPPAKGHAPAPGLGPGHSNGNGPGNGNGNGPGNGGGGGH